MKRLTVIYVHRKGNAKNRLKQLVSAVRTTRGKKAIILIALIIPLVFLVLLLFSHMEA